MLLLSEDLPAQQYVLRSITTADGLPSDFVNQFFQDKQGYMWLATDKGASKFDGNQFIRYTVDSGLINNFNISVHQSPAGLFWFSCFGDSALSVQRPGKLEHFKVQSNSVREVYFDKSNRVYYTGYYGFYALDRTLPIPYLQHQAAMYATQLSPDSFLLMYPGHIYLLDVHNPVRDILQEIKCSPEITHGRLVKHKERIYIMGSGSLAQIDLMQSWPWSIRQIEKGGFSNYAAVATDTSLLFANQKGIWEYSMLTGRMTIVNGLFGLPDVGVNDIFRDKQGAIWIATHGAGIVICPPNSVTISESKEERIVSIAGNPYATWMVSANALYELKNHRLIKHRDENIYQNSGLYHTSDGWWLSDYQFLFGPATHPSRLYAAPSLHIPNGVSSFVVSHTGHKYIGTYADGVIRIDAKQRQDTFSIAKGLCSNTIEDLFSLPSGVAAISYSNGFSLIDTNGRCTNYSRKSGLISNTVYAVYQRADTLWVGTEGGVSLFKGGKHVKSITSTHTIVGDKVLYFFSTPDGQLFFLTEKYLHKVVGNQFFPMRSVKIVQREREIIHCYYYCALKNILYVGTSRGVVEIPMQRVVQQTNLPELQIEAIHTSFRPIDLRVHHLHPIENSITYKFTAQAFLHGQAPEIFCQLIGLDTAFKKLYGSYEISYNGLPHGTYQLKAFIKNADGFASEVKVLHAFTVPQYWWRQSWFLGLLTVLSAALLWWVGWLWQKRRFQLRMGMLQLQEEKQLQRERIRRDLHDNIGSQLSYMASQVDWIIHEKDKLSPEEQQHLLETLGDNTREVLTELRDSMWSMKHDAISIELLLSRMQQIIHRWQMPSKGTLIQLEHHVPEILTLNPHIALNLLRIFQEALSNACTHAKASHIKVSISIISDRFLELLVTDNGVGFSMTEDSDDHYGLENMQRRANEAGFNYTIHSTSDVGTIVEVKVPLE